MDIAIDGQVGQVVPIEGTKISASEFSTWSDERVLSAALHYGKEVLHWRRKFLGTLPEIAKRKLYEQHGCSSIFVFAFKVGGASEDQVRKILHVEEMLRDKPALHELLVSGEVSINKMAKIHTVATSENQEFLADQVQLLSKSAVETLAKDMRASNTSNQLSFGPGPELASDHKLELSEEVKNRLFELKHKGIDINTLLTELLDQREREIEEEKASIAQTCEPSASRYIPAKIKKLIKKEHGAKCSIKNCNKASDVIHHMQRHALSQTHDPHYLAPLCNEHHQIAHTIDQKYQEKRRT